MPIAFVALLIPIKKTQEGDLNSKSVNATFPSNARAFAPLSFHDYVVAMQADRTCEEQEWAFSWDENKTYNALGITGISANAWNWMVVR